MPRSQKMMLWLPPAAMYSPAISHSLIVALMPRLRMTGVVTCADRLQQIEILHVARADLDDIHAVLEKRVEHPHIHQLGDHRQPVAPGRILQELQAVDPLALERVGLKCAA